jgi:hypothetical protein
MQETRTRTEHVLIKHVATLVNKNRYAARESFIVDAFYAQMIHSRSFSVIIFASTRYQCENKLTRRVGNRRLSLVLLLLFLSSSSSSMSTSVSDGVRRS